jgi:hypothetical protein
LKRLVAAGLFARDLYRLPEQPVQVLAAAVLLTQRGRDRFKLMVIDPAIAAGRRSIALAKPAIQFRCLTIV